MKKIVGALVAILSSSSVAVAGFQSWSTETESDPFSGGSKITASYFISLRNGVLFMCDTSAVGLTVRAVPGYVYEDRMADYKPVVEFAIDGAVVPGGEGRVVSVGDNLAAVDIVLSGDRAQILLDKFAHAKKQIALKDGMSDGPYLMKARGSTKAGQALLKCAGASNSGQSDTEQTGKAEDEADKPVPKKPAKHAPVPPLPEFMDKAVRALTYSKVCFNLNIDWKALTDYAWKAGVDPSGIGEAMENRFSSQGDAATNALPAGDKCVAGWDEFGTGGTVLAGLLSWY